MRLRIRLIRLLRVRWNYTIARAHAPHTNFDNDALTTVSKYRANCSFTHLGMDWNRDEWRHNHMWELFSIHLHSDHRQRNGNPENMLEMCKQQKTPIAFFSSNFSLFSNSVRTSTTQRAHSARNSNILTHINGMRENTHGQRTRIDIKAKLGIVNQSIR